MDIGLIVGAIGVAVAAISLFRNQTISKQSSDMKVAMAEYGGRMLAAEKVLEMVVKNLTVSFVVEKHRPHPEFKEQDLLIEKFANNSITEDEQADFLRMIEADAVNPTGEMSDRILAGAILELEHARDIIHMSSPAFITLTPGEQMMKTMELLNADTASWLARKIKREKAMAESIEHIETKLDEHDAEERKHW
jgi:hypothetical protein